MSAIHTESAAIFGHKNVNVSEEDIRWVDYKPVNPITQNTVVEFYIPGHSKRYVSLKDSYVHCVVEINITNKHNARIAYLDKPSKPKSYTGALELMDLPPDLPTRHARARRSVPDTEGMKLNLTIGGKKMLEMYGTLMFVI